MSVASASLYRGLATLTGLQNWVVIRCQSIPSLQLVCSHLSLQPWPFVSQMRLLVCLLRHPVSGCSNSGTALLHFCVLSRQRSPVSVSLGSLGWGGGCKNSVGLNCCACCRTGWRA